MNKSASDPTETASLASVASSMLNPFAPITPIDYYAPGSGGKVGAASILFHTALLSLTYLTLGYAGGMIGRARATGKQEGRAKLATRARLGATTPITSLNMNLKDKDTAATDTLATLSSLEPQEKQASAMGEAALLLTLPAGAALVSFMLGSRLANADTKAMDNAQLDKALSKSMNELNALDLKYLAKRRGMSPQEMAGLLGGVDPAVLGKTAQQAASAPPAESGLRVFTDSVKGLWNGMTAFEALLLATAALTSGYAAFKYTRSVDPAEREADQMDSAQTDFVRQRVMSEPVQMLVADPYMKGLIKKLSKPSNTGQIEAAAPAPPVPSSTGHLPPPPKDPTDFLMSKLQG
jgi:hypothetical protein